jgi:hypothetical protein
MIAIPSKMFNNLCKITNYPMKVVTYALHKIKDICKSELVEKTMIIYFRYSTQNKKHYRHRASKISNEE